MEKRGQISLDNPVADEILKRKKKRAFNIFLVVGIVVVVIILGFLAYSYFNAIPNLNYGASIEKASLSEDGKNVYVKLSGNVDFTNITGVDFAFRDSSGKEYDYEVNESFGNIQAPLKKSLLDIILFRNTGNQTYDYLINADELGISNLKSITEIDASFIYKTGKGTETINPAINTTKPTTPVSAVSSGSSGSGGGGGGSGGSNPSPECTATLTCSNYSEQCGTSLSDGCNNVLNCSGNCNSTQNCVSGTCENVIILCNSNPECGTGFYTGNSVCEDNNIFQNYTTFICNNPELANSYCTNSTNFIEKQVCTSGQTCEDAECILQGCTPGTVCRNSSGECDIPEYYNNDCSCPADLFNATTTACSTGFCNGNGDCVACNNNSQCGTNLFSGNLFCSTGNVFQNYTTYTCSNAGTTSSSCSNSISGLLNQSCGVNSCDSFGNNYCNGSNAYHNQTCYSRGCSLGSCTTNSFVNESLVQTCVNGCSSGACICIPSCSGKVCGDNGCGGSCGSCPDGQSCNESFVCKNNSESSWVSFAKDSDNSKIADDDLAPPFKLVWTNETVVNIDFQQHQPQAKLLYSNGILSSIDGGDDWTYLYDTHTPSWGIKSFNSDTGQLNWNSLVYHQDGTPIINNNYVIFGGIGGDQEGTDYTVANVSDGTIPSPQPYVGVDGDYSLNQDNSSVYSLTVTRISSPTTGESFLRKIQPSHTSLESYVNGNFGKALQFPDNYSAYALGNWYNNDYLTINKNTLEKSFQADASGAVTNNITLSFWVNLGDNSQEGYRVLLANGVPYSEYANYIGFNCASSVCTLFHNLFSYPSYSITETISNINFSTNQWHQITFTYDHQNERWYLDGQLENTTPQTQDLQLFNMYYNNLPLYLGSGKGGNSISGAVDEFAIYNRTLNYTEVENNWNNTITPDSSTALLYHFDNDPTHYENESFVYDYSGNGNNAFYDRHLNTEVIWEQPVQMGWVYENINSFYSYAGQMAVHNNILYVPNQILTAYNTTDGSVIWTNGNISFTTTDVSSIGNIVYDHEVVYYNNSVYTIGLEKIQNNTWEYFLFGFDAATGNQLLNKDLGISKADCTQAGSIVVDNNTAYVRTDGEIQAVNMTDGNILWQAELSIYGTESWLQSLFISGDNIFVSENKGFSVFNKVSGNKVWQFVNPDTNYSVYSIAPAIIESGGKIFASFTNMGSDSNSHTIIYAFEQGYTNPQIINSVTSLPQGNLQAYYNYIFKANYGETPYIWSVSSGSLPSGLSLTTDSNNNGVITGTPTGFGDFNFTIRVTDNTGNYTEKNFTLIVSSWIPRDSNRSWQSVAISADGSKQTALVNGGYIYVSNDSGNTWTPRMNDSNRTWRFIAMSSNGSIQTATAYYSQIYVSTDYGNIWTLKNNSLYWWSIAMSANGSVQTATVSGGQIYVSTDYGNTWIPKDSNRNWYSNAMSADGSKQTALVNGGYIYVSNDSGNTWTPRVNDSNRNWIHVAMSADGSVQTATVSGGQIYVSTDYGNTWNLKNNSLKWWSIAMSANGSVQTATVSGGQIYVSTDYGNTWTPEDNNRYWNSVAMSSDGSVQTATVSGGQIYIYNLSSQGVSYQSSLNSLSMKSSLSDEILYLFKLILDSLRNPAGTVGRVIGVG